jgi:hypothetical protein
MNVAPSMGLTQSLEHLPEQAPEGVFAGIANDAIDLRAVFDEDKGRRVTDGPVQRDVGGGRPVGVDPPQRGMPGLGRARVDLADVPLPFGAVAAAVLAEHE